MRLNTKVRYGLRTMIEIAMNAGNKGMLQKEISRNQDIPNKYLDKIIADLKSAGLIVNVSGKKSGYRLARPAREITLYDIYQASEGKILLIECLNDDTGCCRNEVCASQEYWYALNTEIEAILYSKNLDSLAKRQKQFDQQSRGTLDFQI